MCWSLWNVIKSCREILTDKTATDMLVVAVLAKS